MSHKSKRAGAGDAGPSHADRWLAGELIGSESKTVAEHNQLPRGETAFDHGAPSVVAVYNGRDHLGSIAIGRSIRAVDPDGNEIGRFDTKEAARAAVVRHALGARP